MGFWKRQRVVDEAREADIEQARAELVHAKAQHAKVVSQAEEVSSVASYLAERRELNHFGESLAISFLPRRQRHA